jgi:hypothetical protein
MRWREVVSVVSGGVGQRRREMESEIVRLRAENRALMNSILGIAGVPPVTVSAESVAALGSDAESAVGAAVTAATAKRDEAATKKDVVPMRRRSWHPVNRMFEIDAARVKTAVEEI